MTRILALVIVDEAGNMHGPFTDSDEIAHYVDSRALGEERDEDDTIGRGWFMRAANANDGLWRLK